MLRLCLDSDGVVVEASQPGRGYPVREPLPPPCAELNHPESPESERHRLQQVDPLEIVLVLDRRRCLQLASARVIREPLEEREVGDPGLYAEEVHVPTCRSLPAPWLDPPEHRVRLRTESSAD